MFSSDGMFKPLTMECLRGTYLVFPIAKRDSYVELPHGYDVSSTILCEIFGLAHRGLVRGAGGSGGRGIASTVQKDRYCSGANFDR